MGHDSPIRSESSRRERSRSSHSTKSPNKEKPSNRRNPSKHTRSRSPVRATDSRSPSPRSKRLRRERDRSNHKDDKSSEKNYGKTRSPESRSESPRTRRLKRAESDKSEKLSDRRHERDRKSVRDAADDNGQEREHHKSRHRSPRDEGNHLNEDDHRNDNDDDSVTQMKAAAEALETKEKQKPSFELSGKLAAETNRVKGVTLLFTEPPDARKPEVRWRLYVFKGGEVLNEPLYVHRQTCYLFGRERRVADIPTDHPSCSKQHAVLQYRQVEKEQPDGMLAKQIRPYIMDLGSTNGTFINDNRIEAERYYELMEKDTLKFGNSSREYVLLHENSA